MPRRRDLLIEYLHLVQDRYGHLSAHHLAALAAELRMAQTEPLPPDAIKLNDPIIVVEVLSPSSLARDAGAKLEDYFRLPSVCHYPIVKTENRTIIHQAHGADGIILTRIVREGPILLDPPGIKLSDCFPPGVD